MTILLVLIPLGLVLLGLAVAAFVWAVRQGQFEDLEGEGSRILFDEEPAAQPAVQPTTESTVRRTETHQAQKEERTR